EAGNHWLTLLLIGQTSNRDAVGAVVTVRHGGARQVLTRFGGGSYLSAGGPRLHVGLGGSRSGDAVAGRWPSGRVETFTDLEADRGYALREGDPKARPLTGFREQAPRSKISGTLRQIARISTLKRGCGAAIVWSARTGRPSPSSAVHTFDQPGRLG